MEKATDNKPKPKYVLTASSRFNLLFMKRTNLLAVIMFVVGITAKLVYWILND